MTIAISKYLAQQIVDLRYETGLGLAEFALEKDFHMASALEVINEIDLGPHYKLVFCGGTCLSKAYGLLDRMSEDVDFKLIPLPAAKGLSKTAARGERKAIKSKVMSALEESGFVFAPGSDKSRDDNNYQMIGAGFESLFPQAVSMRPEIKLEMNAATLVLPTVSRPTGRLFELLVHGAYQTETIFECVSLEEALVEKLISFPRRLASELDGESKSWDHALVRHLYDVYRIKEKAMQALADSEKLAAVIAKVIQQDASEFPNHLQFLENPQGTMLRALNHAKESRSIQAEYDAFCRDMVYAPTVPSYEEALGTFRAVLLAALPERIDMAEPMARRQAWLANKARQDDHSPAS